MRLQLSFTLDFQPVEGRKGLFVGDWSDDALAKLKKQREQKQLQDGIFLERQRIKRAHGLPLWRDIRKKVRDTCTTFNTKAEATLLRSGDTQETRLVVVFEIDGHHRQLNALFDEETAILSWECGDKSGSWQVFVPDIGEARFQSGMYPTTQDSIVKEMLDALVFG